MTYSITAFKWDSGAPMFMDQDGRFWDVVAMIDNIGEETDDPSEAVVLVLQLQEHDDVFVNIDLREFEVKDSMLH